MSRCVNCAYPRERHTLDGNVLRCVGWSGQAGRTYQSMDLPPGKTCNNCHFVKKCCALYGKTPTDQTCDFFPVRFMERPL